MIYVDRSKVPIPNVLNPEHEEFLRTKNEREAAKAFFADKNSLKSQNRFRFKVYIHPQIKDALINLFEGKCAYCETSILATQPGDIEQYRPKSSVSENNNHPGYWWLASDWDNLLISCNYCNRRSKHNFSSSNIVTVETSGKGNRFPLLRESSRAFTPGDESGEHPLILNPCATNPELRPEKHLIFLENGEVVSETKEGQTTIMILGLNRMNLIDSRSKHYVGVKVILADLKRSIKDFESILEHDSNSKKFREFLMENIERNIKSIRAYTEINAPYLGMTRQLIFPQLEKLLSPYLSREELSELIGKDSVRTTSKKRKSSTIAFNEFLQDQADYSFEEEEGIKKFKSVRRLIEHIEIRNIKAIHHLKLDLVSKEQKLWLMLLGENATGKSTILKSIALALLGAEYLKELVQKRGVNLNDFIRNGCQSGIIKIKLSGIRDPHQLTIKKDKVIYKSPLGKITTIEIDGKSIQIYGEPWKPQLVFLGYGSTRLLPRQELKERFGTKYARVDNLFDPFVPLLEANELLLELNTTQFNRVAITLKELLLLGEKDQLIQDKAHGKIMVKSLGTKVSLKQLSDGYQTVVALVSDILEVANSMWSKPEEAEVIVLLDEVGTHLHPTWKMKIVSSLRSAFPRMQFIATTHQPLCLRGLLKDEIVVMKRDEKKRIYAITELPDPQEYRVDQLLTSPLFGLYTTHDPAEEILFDEYYELAALLEPNDKQKKRIEALKIQLKDRKHLGNSRREELMYEVIDTLLAQENKRRVPTDIKKLKGEAVEKVQALWKKNLDFTKPKPTDQDDID